MSRNPQKLSALALILLLWLTGCGPNWEATVVAPDGSSLVVNAEFLEGLADYADEERGVPLERVLWTAGYYAIDRVIVSEPEGARHEFAWADVADDAWWQENGQVEIGGEGYPVARVEAEPTSPDAEPASPEELAQAGQQVFEQACALCHNLTAEALVGPGLAQLFNRDQLPNGKPFSEENLKEWIVTGGGAMPGVPLTEEQLAQVVAYLKEATQP